ncbi:MAG: response regulator [Elusimicrobia bacterium]|nr:response regulator [Elusimicrobiota bacterium]
MAEPNRILVVDDNGEDIQLIAKILEPAGWAVVSAHDARDGLDLASRERFDVVLLDNRFINSPVVGISLISEYSAKIPGGVVMMSAFGDEELEKDAKLLGAASYLAKPFDADQLLKTVSALAARRPPASS